MLANALLVGAHWVCLRDASPLLLLSPTIDTALAVLLLLGTRAGVGLALGRSVLGLGFALFLLKGSEDPAPGVLHLLLCGSVAAWLALEHRSPWRRLALAGPVLYLVGWATLGVSLVRTEDVVTVARLRLEGKLEPDTVSSVEGRAEPYRLPLPGGPWHAFTSEAARANETDTQLYSSELGIAVEVATTRLPGIGRANLEVIEARMRALLSQAQPELEIVSSRELPGPWDNGRLVRLRGRIGGLSQEGAVALYTWGDRIFRVTASAPAWRYHDVAQRLEELVVGFQYEPPPRPFLSAEVARKVKEATVLVQTPYGMGSAFIVADKNVYYLLTNTHVLATPDHGTVSEARILFSGESRGVLTAEVSAIRENADVALLWMSVVGKAVPALPLRTERPKNGTPVVACGFPLGDTFQLGDTHPEPTLNSGSILEAKAEPPSVYKGGSIMKADVGINPGNSGGPVVDLDGAVVGLVVAAYVGSETSFVIPTETALPTLRDHSVKFSRASGPSPEEAVAAPEALLPPPAAQEALRASTVAVRTEGEQHIGVVLQVPEHPGVLVLTQGERLSTERSAQVEFNLSQPDATVVRPGKVLHSERGTGLALIQVEDFPDPPPGLPLGDTSGLRETDRLLLSGGRKLGEKLLPVNRTAILTGIEQAQRWKHGPQEPAMLRVDAGIGSSILPGPAMDAKGRLVGFVTEHLWATNITVLTAAEQLRELLAGRPRSMALRARRNGTGGCHVDLFVDAEAPLSLPRTVELALDEPGTSLDDGLEPHYGPDVPLGTLEGHSRIFHLERSSCPRDSLSYRVKLSSPLKTQDVEGILALPLLPAVRTQHLLPLESQEQPSEELLDFMRWSDLEAASPPPPADLEAALAACRVFAPSCAEVIARATGSSKARALMALRAACLREGAAPACIGLADMLGASTPERELPPKEALEALDQGCKAGLAQACERLGEVLMDRGMRPEHVRAVGVLTHGCELGSGPSCSLLGFAASDGKGLQRDEAMSLRMYRRACRLNVSDACLNAGTMSLRRRSALGDTQASYEAFLRGCVLGRKEACLEMTQTGTRSPSAGYTPQ